MALKYILQVKTEVSLLNFIEIYLNKKTVLFSKEKINKGINIYLYEVLGFMFSFTFSEKVFFDYLIDENKVVEENWDYSSDIHFRLDKFYDNLLARLNMIEVCVYILNNTKEDIRLLFSGDILVLERTNGIISINKNFGFWNTSDLLGQIKMIV
ncbi:hypothetical protein I2486_07665 [Cellulophaga sp. E16_2]|uniref:SitI3 family protein n=1 Tax=Cellulophaga sp. E16_2 TaxID=2789297 RepID=UPI001A92CBD3|nr:SitI3 family protein [Cellulophaga sp. E16_2]MBO0591283.1 hypothetical protein [Cellulophaga sp. E16_2]